MKLFGDFVEFKVAVWDASLKVDSWLVGVGKIVIDQNILHFVPNVSLVGPIFGRSCIAGRPIELDNIGNQMITREGEGGCPLVFQSCVFDAVAVQSRLGLTPDSSQCCSVAVILEFSKSLSVSVLPVVAVIVDSFESHRVIGVKFVVEACGKASAHSLDHIKSLVELIHKCICIVAIPSSFDVV